MYMGMTVFEQQVAQSTINKNRAICSHLENIDWEQRRYEIARDVLSAILTGKSYYPKPKDAVAIAVEYSDELISKLKKEKDG